MTGTTQRLLEKWDHEGVRRRSGVAPAQLAAFERHYAIRLPLDLRNYLLATDGMEETDLDGDMFAFWPLYRIRPIHKQLPEPHYAAYRNFPGAESFFCFADWSINAEVFCIELHSDPTLPNRILALGPRFLPMTSFSEFVDAYVADARRLII